MSTPTVREDTGRLQVNTAQQAVSPQFLEWKSEGEILGLTGRELTQYIKEEKEKEAVRQREREEKEAERQREREKKRKLREGTSWRKFS